MNRRPSHDTPGQAQRSGNAHRTIASETSRALPGGELPARLGSPCRRVRHRVDSLNTDCVNAHYVVNGQRDPVSWLRRSHVGPQADRSCSAADHRRHDGQGTPGSRRCGTPAHTARRECGHLRHHAAGHDEPPRRGYTLPDRLEYQDDDGRGDHATGSGRLSQSRRSSLEVRCGRTQRRQHHHRRTAGNA